MKCRQFTSLLLLVLSLILVPAALANTTWYVDGPGGSDANNCMSPETACKTIGHAISLAGSGDSIMVAAAIYVENLRIGISLNVIGSGSGTTIVDGASRDTVVAISSASAQVTLAEVSIRNGIGHGIANVGALALNDSTVTGNVSSFYGAGIYNSGLLMINNSTVSANRVSYNCFSNPCFAFGGGIYSSGTLRISNSTIGSNSVHLNCFGSRTLTCQAGGAGIIGEGTLTINNSTIGGNLLYVYCTGHPCSAFGGGIFINVGDSTISNSTISGNGSGGGIYNYGGYRKITALQNSIVADNGPGNCAGTVTSNGYNLSSDATCSFSGPGDLNNTDPKLGTLGYYGGPTQTIPLLSGSPAIDAGNPSGCTDGQGNLLKTDQRGMPRPDPGDTGGCDMGAYESQGN